MVNIHTDDRVLTVKIFSSFKYTRPKRFIHLSVFSLFFAGRHCFIAAKEEGEGGCQAGLFGGFLGNRMVFR